MAGVELQQVNHCPGDEFPRSMLCRPYNDALQNVQVGNAMVSPFIGTLPFANTHVLIHRCVFFVRSCPPPSLTNVTTIIGKMYLSQLGMLLGEIDRATLHTSMQPIMA
jgi:hypothetical protein